MRKANTLRVADFTPSMELKQPQQITNILADQVFNEFDLRYSFDSGRRKAIIYGVEQPKEMLLHGSFHDPNLQAWTSIGTDDLSAEEKEENEADKTSICLVEFEAHFYEVIPVSQFEAKYESGKKAIGFPINAVSMSFSDDKALGGLVGIIKKLQEEGGIYMMLCKHQFMIKSMVVFKYAPVSKHGPGSSTLEVHLLWALLLSYIFKFGVPQELTLEVVLWLEGHSWDTSNRGTNLKCDWHWNLSDLRLFFAESMWRAFSNQLEEDAVRVYRFTEPVGLLVPATAINSYA
ncbi:hypothetical protein BJ741DRAFT_652159 [Chytriomyces cf. hyalinus JEL632]|nr:hypothetical protein BJ741DRAFT_652159 [Chytriomyces cf. hyalinus JEL632]